MRTAPVGSVSDHRAESRTTKCPSPLPDVGVTAIRETCTASCGDITPRSSLLQTHASIPLALLSFGLSLVRGVSAGCYQPLLRRAIPTLSLRILPWVPGPLSRRSRGVHLPVSSSTSSAFPRTLSRSASRLSPSKRFHDGSLFRDCSHSFMFRPPSLLASRDRSYRCDLSSQGSRGFYVRAEHASLPPHASDMLTTRPGNWWCGDLHPTRFAALSAAPV